MRFSHARNAQQFKEERITDGDYVYGPDMQGVFYVSLHFVNHVRRKVELLWSSIAKMMTP